MIYVVWFAVIICGIIICHDIDSIGRLIQRNHRETQEGLKRIEASLTGTTYKL